jgi:hypothetical protein
MPHSLPLAKLALLMACEMQRMPLPDRLAVK